METSESRLSPAGGPREERSRASFNEISPFLARQCAAFGVEDLVERARLREPLTASEAAALLDLPFPMLGALVECRERLEIARNTAPCVPALAVSFAARLESLGKKAAIDSSKDQITLVRETHRIDAGLVLYVDRWKTSGSIEELAEALLELAARCNEEAPTALYGPSTGELRSMLAEQTAGEAGHERIFSVLRNPLVTGVEGGTDATMYRLAASAGVPIFYAHSLLKSRLLPENAAGTSDAQAASRCGETFLSELFELRETLLPTGMLRGWCPWSTVLLDRAQPKESAPLGLELARAVAIARLVLPEVPVVRAPVLLFGAKLAHLALMCGANDLGPVAVDLETSSLTGLLHREDVLREFFVDDAEVFS